MKTTCPDCTGGFTQGPDVVPGFANINKCARCNGTGEIPTETTWYLWARHDDPATNEYLAKVIGEQNSEYWHSDKLCADGKKRNLCRCPKGYANVQSAISAIAKFDLKIEIFQENAEDVISRYDLWKPSARKAARLGRFKK